MVGGGGDCKVIFVSVCVEVVLRCVVVGVVTIDYISICLTFLLNNTQVKIKDRSANICWLNIATILVGKCSLQTNSYYPVL